MLSLVLSQQHEQQQQQIKIIQLISHYNFIMFIRQAYLAAIVPAHTHAATLTGADKEPNETRPYRELIVHNIYILFSIFWFKNLNKITNRRSISK